MIHEIITQIQELDDRFRRTGSATWYRGQRKTDWPLKSTLHRYVERLVTEVEMPSEDMRELLRDEAKTRCRLFKQEAWPLLESSERSEWGILFAMQHYRLPTRLLDWTEGLLCALFFAWKRQVEHGEVSSGNRW